MEKTVKKAEVTKGLSGIKVAFSGGVEKQSVVSMVERCQGGQCDCMSDEAKKKIEGLEVAGENGSVELNFLFYCRMRPLKRPQYV
ncbi:MAG: hypothetical protein P8Y65_11200 [Campylobacterales bacterium]